MIRRNRKNENAHLNRLPEKRKYHPQYALLLLLWLVRFLLNLSHQQFMGIIHGSANFRS
jgi:hypothetical protein